LASPAATAADDGRRQKRRHTAPSSTFKLSAGLVDTYRRVNPAFVWLPIQNPRRVLTKDPRPAGNNNYDNKACDMILTVGDVMNTPKGHKFRIVDLLGQGTFGQVVKCRAEWSRGPTSAAATAAAAAAAAAAEDVSSAAASDTDRMDEDDFFGMLPRMVAVKVVKNKPAYYNQAKVEIKVLKKVGDELGPGNDPRIMGSSIIRLLYDFEWHHHLCLIFELMSVNLYELIKHQEFRGLPFATVRAFSRQLLDALVALAHLGVVHCDLKPENVLLENFGDPKYPRIKLIDLGSACYQDHTVYTYIQSRFYRAPEVIMGLKYGPPIDLWSLGCCVVELFMGLPVFPGVSAHNQMARIVEMCGLPPPAMIRESKKGKLFFVETDDNKKSPSLLADAVVELREDYFTTPAMQHDPDEIATSANGWRIKTAQEWAVENALREGPEKTKRYVKEKTLYGIIARCEAKRRPKNEPVEALSKQDIDCFVNFCQGLLAVDPAVRWTAMQAAQHPFAQEQPYTGPFVPPPDMEESLLVSSSAETARGDKMSEASDDEDMDIDMRISKTMSMPWSIAKKPAAATRQSATSSSGTSLSLRGSQKRKISDVQSPTGSLSSVLGSPIARPEAPYPIAHAARWSDLGLLGSPFFSAKMPASPSWMSNTPGGGLESPRTLGNRMGVSLPPAAASMLASSGDEVRHASFRRINFDDETLALAKQQPRAQQPSWGAFTASAAASAAATAQQQDAKPLSNSGDERKSPFVVEKSLAKWAPFNGQQQQPKQT